MSPAMISLIALVCILGGTLFGMFLVFWQPRPRTPWTRRVPGSGRQARALPAAMAAPATSAEKTVPPWSRRK
jgi:hypothetical protein